MGQKLAFCLVSYVEWFSSGMAVLTKCQKLVNNQSLFTSFGTAKVKSKDYLSFQMIRGKSITYILGTYFDIATIMCYCNAMPCCLGLVDPNNETQIVDLFQDAAECHTKSA